MNSRRIILGDSIMRRAARRSAELVRIVSINDIYDISNFPAFAALLRHARAGAHTTLVCVNGDFLSPNALSALDKGRSVVDCFNHLGVTHVCLGNVCVRARPTRARPTRAPRGIAPRAACGCLRDGRGHAL